MPRIFSGIQPSGKLHLGNYIGAIKQWVELQNEHDAIFCIVNLHAITAPQNPPELHKQTLATAAMYIACGINPAKSTIFIQSHVPAHTELAWILATHTPLGDMERMTQYKDKVQKGKPANVGLFTYPILMAADILLYQTALVPVGEDQLQHVEFARSIAKRMNNKYGELFTIPNAVPPKTGARIMGLDDPNVKMSKSAKSAMNFIALMDTPDVVEKKIKKAVTDSGTDIVFDLVKKPAITNLLTIEQALTGKSKEEITAEFSGKRYGDLKDALTETCIAFLKPIQTRYTELLNDERELERLLNQGKDKAETIANATLNNVRTAMGLNA